ncbi:MAG: hypothetical protein MUE75_07535 [Algoriphagus sp.]|nr:hypothetical protein [Algoriphagus sp.]
MKNYKHVASFFLIYLFGLQYTFSQDFEMALARTMKYPKEARDQKVEEIVYLYLDIDENGRLQSYNFHQEPHAFLKKEISRTMDLLQKDWKTTYLGDRTYSQKYLAILEFTLNSDIHKAQLIFEDYSKSRSENNQVASLKLINECIEINPYNEKYLAERSTLHRELGNIPESQADLLRSRKLKKELLTYMVISGVSLR